MNATQIHLFITHLPVFGLFLSLLALLYGAVKKNKDVNLIALVLLLVSVSGGIIAYLTGESAEEAVESLAGVSEGSIEEHEDAAEITVILFYSLAAMSLIALYVVAANRKIARTLMFVTLGLQILTFGSVVRTASLGGKIRHTEISQSGSTQSQDAQDAGSQEEDDD